MRLWSLSHEEVVGFKTSWVDQLPWVPIEPARLGGIAGVAVFPKKDDATITGQSFGMYARRCNGTQEDKAWLYLMLLSYPKIGGEQFLDSLCSVVAAIQQKIYKLVPTKKRNFIKD